MFIKNKIYIAVLFLNVCLNAKELSLEEAFSNESINAQIRSIYMSQINQMSSNALSNDNSAFGIGGNLGFKTAIYDGVLVNAKFYTTNLIASSANFTSKPLTGYFGSYSVFGQIYAQAQFDKTRVRIGRQEVNTPLLGADDGYFIPNLFQGISIQNKDIPNTVFRAMFLNGMLGGTTKDSNTNSNTISSIGTALNNPQMASATYGVNSAQTNFSSLSRSASGNLVNYAPNGSAIGDTPMFILSAVNNSIKNLSVQLWYYENINFVRSLYAMAEPTFNLNENSSIYAGAIYYNTNAAGAAKGVLGAIQNPNNQSQNLTINYNVYSFKLGYKNSYGLTPEIATTYIDGTQNSTYILGAWGGYPNYSDMTHHCTSNFAAYLSTGGANPKGSSQWKFSLTSDLDKLGFGAHQLQIAYGNYHFNPNNNYYINQSGQIVNGLNMDLNVFDFVYLAKNTLIENLSIKAYFEQTTFKNPANWANVIGGSSFANTKSATYLYLKGIYSF